MQVLESLLKQDGKATQVMEQMNSQNPNPKQANSKKNLREGNLYKARKQEVIPILTDEEEKVDLEAQIMEEHFKYEITKAQLSGSSFQKIMAILKYLQPGETLQEKEDKVRALIKRYFQDKINIDIQTGNLLPRCDQGLLNNPGMIYETKYLVYGIDLMTTRQVIRNYNFKNPNKKLLDTSHMLLEFKQVDDGIKFLEYQVMNFNTNLFTPMENNPNIRARKWVPLSCYKQLIFHRQLFIRNYTQADEMYFMQRVVPPDNYKLYQHAKNELLRMVLQRPNVKKIMEEIADQEQVQTKNSRGYRKFMKEKSHLQRDSDKMSKMSKQIDRDYQQRQIDKQRYRDGIPCSDYRKFDYGQFNKKTAGYEFKNKEDEQRYMFQHGMYKGNPRVFPDRYGIDNIGYTRNPNKPDYVPPSKEEIEMTKRQFQHYRHYPNQQPMMQPGTVPQLFPTYVPQDQDTDTLNKPQNAAANGINGVQSAFPNGVTQRQKAEFGNEQPRNGSSVTHFYDIMHGSGEAQNNQSAGFPQQTDKTSSLQDKSNNSLPVNLPNTNLMAEDLLFKQKEPSISSEFHSLQRILQNIHLFSGSDFSSIGERSKHQISNIQQIFESNASSDFHLSGSLSNVLNSQLQASNHQNISSGLDIQQENPDFKNHLVLGGPIQTIQMIAHTGIKEEDEDLAELLGNVTGKDNKEKEDVDNEDSSDWNLNIDIRPVKKQVQLESKGEELSSKMNKKAEIFEVDD